MSTTAMAWAFQQEAPPSIKFVLVCLADNAGHSGEAWPSIANLQAKTCMDRKTIIAALDALEANGLLVDTGKRVGRTAQVKVYRLNGFWDGEYHYVYRLVDPETKEFYIGVRSCCGDPNTDAYLGSGVWPLACARERRKLAKEVISTFKNRQEAEEYERARIAASSDDPLCRNRAKPERSQIWNRSPAPPKESQNSHETVPLFPAKSPKNGTRNHQESVTEPSTTHAGADGFDEFWSAYPRKEKKLDAAKAWAKLKPDQELRATIAKAIATQKAGAQWQRGYVPHPSTWLNGRRWDDELALGATQVAPAGQDAAKAFAEVRAAIRAGRKPEAWTDPRTERAVIELGGFYPLSEKTTRDLDFLAPKFAAAFAGAAP